MLHTISLLEYRDEKNFSPLSLDMITLFLLLFVLLLNFFETDLHVLSAPVSRCAKHFLPFYLSHLSLSLSSPFSLHCNSPFSPFSLSILHTVIHICIPEIIINFPILLRLEFTFILSSSGNDSCFYPSECNLSFQCFPYFSFYLCFICSVPLSTLHCVLTS